MPARKKPVKNLKLNKPVVLIAGINIPRLNIAAMIEQTKKTLTGENRSAIIRMANINVPMINPSCTALVRWATKLLSSERV